MVEGRADIYQNKPRNIILCGRSSIRAGLVANAPPTRLSGSTHQPIDSRKELLSTSWAKALETFRPFPFWGAELLPFLKLCHS